VNSLKQPEYEALCHAAIDSCEWCCKEVDDGRSSVYKFAVWWARCDCMKCVCDEHLAEAMLENPNSHWCEYPYATEARTVNGLMKGTYE